MDFVDNFAKALYAKSPNVVFCLMSVAGADTTEKSRMMFAQDKGIAENRVMAVGFSNVQIFRPGYIHPSVKRKAPNFMYTVNAWIYPLFKKIYPSGVITSEELAKVMIKQGLSAKESKVYENKELKEILNA